MTKRRHLKSAKLRQLARLKKGKPVAGYSTIKVATYRDRQIRYDDYSLAA